MTPEAARLLVPVDGQPHRYAVVQELRCLGCGARYRTRGQSRHRSDCRGIWWDVDGEVHYYIDGREVTKGEYESRCPFMLPEL